jgi:hypothetical protein
MIARTPVPLRWSETAEADRICNMAMLEYEPQSPVRRLVEAVAGVWRPVLGRSMCGLVALRRLASQIKRDRPPRVR